MPNNRSGSLNNKSIKLNLVDFNDFCFKEHYPDNFYKECMISLMEYTIELVY